MATRFFYEVDGHGYFLVPTYRTGLRGRIWITGVEMYDREQEYIGYWYRENMPQKLIVALARFVKDWEVKTPVRGRPRRQG